jgi:hypothetical protein
VLEMDSLEVVSHCSGALRLVQLTRVDLVLNAVHDVARGARHCVLNRSL